MRFKTLSKAMVFFALSFSLLSPFAGATANWDSKVRNIIGEAESLAEIKEPFSSQSGEHCFEMGALAVMIEEFYYSTLPGSKEPSILSAAKKAVILELEQLSSNLEAFCSERSDKSPDEIKESISKILKGAQSLLE